MYMVTQLFFKWLLVNITKDHHLITINLITLCEFGINWIINPSIDFSQNETQVQIFPMIVFIYYTKR